ncbi:MAG: hypothetical protein HFJ30_05130 [Clostridia bacterium]|nr:hypothetical protein [Clostridia bacterium]MCI9413357.1 hypothetical protein [Clostridia bacterium]
MKYKLSAYAAIFFSGVASICYFGAGVPLLSAICGSTALLHLYNYHRKD